MQFFRRTAVVGGLTAALLAITSSAAHADGTAKWCFDLVMSTLP